MRRLASLCAVLIAAVASPSMAQSETGSLAGQLLVAAPSMPDPRFQGTVIYMCEHGGDGALGLVLNRVIATVPGSKVIEQFDLEATPTDDEIRVVWGGPVEYGRGFVLHTSDRLHESSLQVTDEVALTSEADFLVDLLEGRGPGESILALGYAGWQPGQLESELSREDWITVPAGAAFVFGEDPADMWDAAMAMMSIEL